MYGLINFSALGYFFINSLLSSEERRNRLQHRIPLENHVILPFLAISIEKDGNPHVFDQWTETARLYREPRAPGGRAQRKSG